MNLEEITSQNDIADGNYILQDLSSDNKKDVTISHPWRRYFARAIDFLIYSLIWDFFANLILRWNSGNNLILGILESYITIALMLLFEPLLLSTWGSTPGKWIFGLIIRRIDGKRLNYHQALKRTWGVFCIGMGYNLPIYNLVQEYRCFKKCNDTTPMTWEANLTYEIKDTKIYRCAAFIMFNIFLLIMEVLLLLQAQMPIHRGNITDAQYYENCNDMILYNKINIGKHLNKQGQWVDDNHSQSTGSFNVDMSEQIFPSHKLTITDGHVTGVRLEIKTSKDEIMSGFYIQDYIAVNSFLAAQKGMNPIRLYRSGKKNRIMKCFENYSFKEAGIRVTNKIEVTGYDTLDNQYLFPQKEGKKYFHMIFSLQKIK